jgi:serine/threonine protein kinase
MTTSKTCPHCGWAIGSEPELPHHLKPGVILQNKYLIGKVLGQGGFGITYLAWDLNLDLKLAIKEFYPQGLASRVLGKSEVSAYSGAMKNQYVFGLDRFLSEAKTLARFSEYPNIVSVRDFFRANGTAYMVMNYVEGVTLGEYLRQKGGLIPYEQALAIMLPIFDALKEVHRAGIMHRDISPDNIFIDTLGRVMLIDFGAARQELQQKSTHLSVIMKAGYSPEEQYRTRGEQGPWTDIYALAATIYRAITGVIPPESLDRMEEDILESPSALGIDISASQEEVLLKALAVRSRDRYRSIEELQSAMLQNEELAVAEANPDDIALGLSDDVSGDLSKSGERNLDQRSETSPQITTKELMISARKKKALMLVTVLIVFLALLAYGPQIRETLNSIYPITSEEVSYTSDYDNVDESIEEIPLIVTESGFNDMAPEILFEEDFADGYLSGWRTFIHRAKSSDSGWKIENNDDSYYLVGRDHAHSHPPLERIDDCTVSFRFILQEGWFHLNLRESDDDENHYRYFIAIGLENEEFMMIDLNKDTLDAPAHYVEKEYKNIRLTEIKIKQNHWYNLLTEMVGNGIKVYLDNELIYDYVDENSPILDGNISFETLDSSVVMIDDIIVTRTN